MVNDMWVEVKKAPNLMLAEMWKELFEGEGIPVLLVPQGGGAPNRELVSYQVMVPADKGHVAEEVLRKI
jgi:Putative prokaryotic signal transducing protein